VTTVPRTLADVAAAGLAEEKVRQAIREAIERGLTSPETLWRYARKRGGRFQTIVQSVESLAEIG
jgi:hypothetical protein